MPDCSVVTHSFMHDINVGLQDTAAVKRGLTLGMTKKLSSRCRVSSGKTRNDDRVLICPVRVSMHPVRVFMCPVRCSWTLHHWRAAILVSAK